MLEGVRVDPKDLEAVLALKTKAQAVDDLGRVLGFLSYYRAYIQNFSRIPQPLYELLQGKSSALPVQMPKGPNCHLGCRWSGRLIIKGFSRD